MKKGLRHGISSRQLALGEPQTDLMKKGLRHIPFFNLFHYQNHRLT